MPPRKSDASKVAAAAVPTGDEGTPVKEKDGINIEDLNLPKSIVTRLAKGVLPPNTQIQANAVLAMTKSATVFVNYLATQANEHTQAANKKTVSPADVLRALDDLDFSEFRPRLEQELAKFNELATDKRNAYRKRVAAEKAAGTLKGGTPSGTANGESSTPGVNVSAEPDGERATKKVRLDNAEGGERGMSPEGEFADDGMSPENENENENENEEGEGDSQEADEAEEEAEGEGEEAEDHEEEEKEVDADEAMDNGEDSD